MDLEVQNWFVLFSKDHPLAQNGKSSVTLEELSNYDLPLPKNSIASQTIRGLFHMSGFPVNVCVEYEPWTLGARLTSPNRAWLMPTVSTALTHWHRPITSSKNCGETFSPLILYVSLHRSRKEK